MGDNARMPPGRLTHSIGVSSIGRLLAELAAVRTFVPGMFMVVAVMIMIPIALARLGHHATRGERNQSRQETAFNQVLYIIHIISGF
jgi:hypothetical protein